MMADSDSFTAVDRADDFAVAGNNAHARSVQHPPHAPGRGVVGDGLICQLHIGRHAPRHRHAQYAALHEPRPFTRFIDRVFKRHLIFAVQSLGDRAGRRRQGASTVIAEIRTVRRIDADRRESPPNWANKSTAQQCDA